MNPTNYPPRPFDLAIIHRPRGITAAGSAWYLAMSPACPVVVAAALMLRFGLRAELTAEGRLALYSESRLAAPPLLEECAREVAETMDRFAAAHLVGRAPVANVVPFLARKERLC